jgi:Ras-related protein Rab-6A
MRLNISLIGEATVGKTTIAQSLLRIELTTTYKPTIGASMVKIPYPSAPDSLKWFYIWDTAGQERYRALAPVYDRDSVAAILVYDVSARESFDKLSDWLRLYRDSCGEENPLFLIGNKIDLEDRTVRKSEAEEWAQMNRCQDLEVSAKSGENLEKILPTLNGMIDSARLVEQSIQIGEGKKGCCD